MIQNRDEGFFPYMWDMNTIAECCRLEFFVTILLFRKGLASPAPRKHYFFSSDRWKDNILATTKTSGASLEGQRLHKNWGKGDLPTTNLIPVNSHRINSHRIHIRLLCPLCLLRLLLHTKQQQEPTKQTQLATQRCQHQFHLSRANPQRS